MTSGNVEASSDRLRLESIATVDLRLLSQSDLYALSLCSDSAFDPHRCEDVVVPKIDRSVFNESAGSRKQTYSRLRLAPRKAESSFASSTAAVRGRTPHLRAPKSSTVDSTDPERAENTQIISLLKNLFAPEATGDELIPIKVDYSDPVQIEATPNVGINGKRKRGRPRKNENRAVTSAEVAAPVPMEVVVYDNIVDRDKEIVDRHGNAVDLVALGTLENPFGFELQKRTENFRTDEELLEYLKGLNGQWGSRRKKKRIVDAGEFGDVLPKGWKLLLSLKKKEGVIWIYVRRYISPNGRQFVTCKEVSSYLLSLFGLPDPYQLKAAESSDKIQSTPAMAASLAVEVVDKGVDHVSFSPPASANVNGHKEQVIPGVGSPVTSQMGEVLNCSKCSMTFTEKDDLLLHQLSSHRRKRSKFATSITDGVIISGGKYQCQFCHKSFSERNRYNGHVGAHKRHHMKNDELSPGALSFHKSDNHVSTSQVLAEGSVLQTTTMDVFETVTTIDGNTGNEIKPASPQSKLEAGSDIEHHTDRCIPEITVFSHDEQTSNSGKKEQVTEEFCSELSIDNKKKDCLGTVDEDGVADAAQLSICLESADDTKFESNIAGNNETTIGLETQFEDLAHSPSAEEKISGAETSVDGDLEKSNGGAISDSFMSTTLLAQNPCIAGNSEDVGCPGTIDHTKLDSKNDELGHDLCSYRADLDEDDGTVCRQEDSPQSCHPVEVSGDDTCRDSIEVLEASAAVPADTKQEKGSENNTMETFCVNDIFQVTSNSVSKLEMNTLFDEGNKEVMLGCGNGHPGTDVDIVTNAEQENSEICLDDSSWKERSRDTQVNDSMVTVCPEEEHVQEMGSGSSSLILSGYEQRHPVELEMNNVSTMMLKETKLGEGQPYCNNEPVFGIGHHPLSPGIINLDDIGSLDLFPNGKTFDDNILTGVCSSSRELSKQIGSLDNGLLTQSTLEKSFMEKSFSDVYAMNRVPTSSIREPTSSRELPKQIGSLDNGLLTQSTLERSFMEKSFSDVYAMNRGPTSSVREPTSSRELPKQISSLDNGLLSQSTLEKSLSDVYAMNKAPTSSIREPTSSRELPKQIGSLDNGLRSQSTLEKSFMEKSFTDVYAMNRVPTSSIREPRADKFQNANNNGINFAFGNDGSRISDVMHNVPVQPPPFNFGFNVNANNRTRGQDLRRESLLNPLYYAETFNNDKNNLSRADVGSTSRVWNRPMGNEIANSGQNQLTMGFGSNDAQPDCNNVMPGNMWRMREENLLQGTLAGTPTQQGQSTNWFSSFNEISDKDQSLFLGSSGKYDNMPDFGVAQTGHSEPVEFSFLTMQNSNSFPGDNKPMSYNTEMGQAFDTPFWLEKDCLSLNLSARNQVTSSVCSWCRNEFYHDPQHPGGAQTGGIGSICPTCSTRGPQQFNLF